MIEEIETAQTWGRSPILEAAEFGLALAQLPLSANVLLVTDGEDDSQYLRPPETESLPETLGGGPLSVLTLSRSAPGVSSTLVAWVQQSGGEINELRPGISSAPMVESAITSAAVSDHEVQTLADLLQLITSRLAHPTRGSSVRL